MNFFAIFFGIFYVGLGKNRISDKNICFSFSANPVPFWLKILLEKRFFSFWNFFVISFGIFFPESSKNEIRNSKFFLSFSVYIILFWLKIMPERVFLIFWNYLLFFLKFSCPVRVWTEFGTKIFLLLSQTISSPFVLK